MKAIGFTVPGGPEVLTELDLPTPEAGPGELRVRVHAAAVNPADILVRRGDVDLSRLPAPYVPGMDVAGVVEQVGPGTETDLAVGDRVMAVVMPDRPHSGGYAEAAVVPARQAVAAPANVSLAEAATIPMNGLTALRALHVLGVRDGSTVAVTGAAGVFGGFFVELAKLAGARVVADSSERDEPLLRRLGADLIVRRGPTWATEVRRFLPTGVDALADAALLGPSALDAVADNGRYASLRTPGEPGTTPLPTPAPRAITYHPVAFYEHPDFQSALHHLRDAVEATRLTPRIHAVVAPTDAPHAHTTLQAGGTRGRIVLDFSPS
ncbi:NADP-dependent oxidoreductase [Actinocorallia sp. A-T 12471]|uniref:quinone oxidoreductase family protein n=1 Tax=Actinocorallia sp. A-T 12471 TaxID=3089813 RepID=UPI0029D0EE9A|nr:NADP-dependent oxidoreductase [Actinocorallia sp. A-T 12471]MDX6740580.1 NADP-dependent oxidoreductase [Actinocorallia sp. A-T 12471]